MRLLTEDNDNPIIIRPHIVFTDGRQQRQPNHNTTKYYVNRRKTTTTTQSKHENILCSLTDDNDNPIITRPHIVLTDEDNNDNPTIIRPHIMFTDGIQRQPNHNTTTYCVY